MAAPNGLRFLEERTLDDEEAWKEEAEAVIRDIRECVDFADISTNLKVGGTVK